MEPKTQSKALSWLRGMLACRGEWLADVVAGLAVMCEHGGVAANDVADAVSAFYLSPLPEDEEVSAALDAMAEAGLVHRFGGPSVRPVYLISARERPWISRHGARQWLVLRLSGSRC